MSGGFPGTGGEASRCQIAEVDPVDTANTETQDNTKKTASRSTVLFYTVESSVVLLSAFSCFF